MVKSLKLNTPFKKGIPGRDWFRGLKGRHPEIAIKNTTKMSVTRDKPMNKEVPK